MITGGEKLNYLEVKTLQAIKSKNDGECLH